jgi:glutathione synthase/RimK-type ligase-like ATP-grasp enzyme
LIGARGVEVIEVNGTPSFRGIFEATACDMAPAIVEQATRAMYRRRQRAS